MTILSRAEARQVYDRIGARQDRQAFYEDPATELLLRHGKFGCAERIFEFGCGTGRFAYCLLSKHLPGTAGYKAVDSSAAVAELARQRLALYGSRAEVLLTDGSPPTAEAMGHFDRFVSNYVLDLLSLEDIAAVIRGAHRMLDPHGLLCLASLCIGCGLFSRVVARGWSFVHRLQPSLVGGCRPIDLPDQLPKSDWQISYHACVAAFGVPSEIVIAQRRTSSST